MMIVTRSPSRARALERMVAGPSAYNEGWVRGADPRGDHADCPFTAPLLAPERAEWLRGFVAGRQDRRD